MGYIKRSHLARLREYKYSGVDHSLVSRYVLKPFYTNVAIKCFPRWLAPNAITLSGFAFVIINFATLLWYNPGLDTDCPAWVYASWSVGLFLYQTFDAVDGQQARRTGQSGPLGELFDHGVDALNTVLEVLLFAGATNLGQGWKTVATLFASLLTFYVQTWDEYHTKTLTLGLVSGPVEGIMTLYIVYAVTAVKGGASFWQQSMLPSLGVAKPAALPDNLYNLAWNEWWMIYGGLVLVANTYQSIMNVSAARRARNKATFPAIAGLFPIFALGLMMTSYLITHPAILHHHLIPFALYMGLINAYAVGEIITAHVTKAAFPAPTILVVPLLVGIADMVGPGLQRASAGALGWPSLIALPGFGMGDLAFVWLALGISVGVYASFVVDVIHTICEELDIWCLTIKHPLPEHQKTN